MLDETNMNDPNACTVENFEPETIERKLTEIKSNLNTPVMKILYNMQRANTNLYGEKKIERFSTMYNYMFDKDHPTWSYSHLQTDLFKDRTDPLGFITSFT